MGNMLVSAGTLYFLAERFAICSIATVWKLHICLLAGGLTHVDLSLRLRKASCLLKRGAMRPRELLKVLVCCESAAPGVGTLATNNSFFLCRGGASQDFPKE